MRMKKLLSKAQRGGLVVGRISVNRKGYGFVQSPSGDIYVSGRDINGAMHGDTVGVKVVAGAGRFRRRGSVQKVLERANETIVGRFEGSGRHSVVIPTDARIRTEVLIDRNATLGAKTGDIVVARLTAYPSRQTYAQGVVEEVIGKEGTPGLEIEVIIRQHGLRVEFPPAVLDHAEAIELDVTQALQQATRRDLRDVYTFTIDPHDARDFDDAITVERIEGALRLGVHIADVSHYVAWGDPVDEEARRRTTSVYLVDRVLPMLPEKLSNHLCSLNPNEDRLAFSVMMDMDANGAVVGYELFQSVIRSDRRMDYDEVQRYLDGTDPWPDEASETAVREFARAAALLGKRRVARGGLDFETVEARVRLAPDGEPLEIVLRERTQATNMIEEAMIRANEVVAAHMTEALAPMIYRIHEDPDPEALAQVAVILKEFDYPATDVADALPATFQRIIEFAHDRPEKRLINYLLLRAMQRAKYTAYLAPHFGLASEEYTHFTSPIRRYPDLLAHRLLAAQLAGELETPEVAEMAEALEWMADHCSVMEREAEAAEDESTRVKIAQLMLAHLGEVFEGLITGVNSFGLFVQLDNTAEGLVHVRRMTDDYYELDAERLTLSGSERGRTYRLGERVSVRLIDVSVAEARIDFELVS